MSASITECAAAGITQLLDNECGPTSQNGFIQTWEATFTLNKWP